MYSSHENRFLSLLDSKKDIVLIVIVYYIMSTDNQSGKLSSGMFKTHESFHKGLSIAYLFCGSHYSGI